MISSSKSGVPVVAEQGTTDVNLSSKAKGIMVGHIGVVGHGYIHMLSHTSIISLSKWHFPASTAPNSPRTRTEDGCHSVSILAALAAYVSENSCCEIDPANGFAGFYTVRETPNSLIRKVFRVLEDGQHRRSHFDAKPQIPRRMER